MLERALQYTFRITPLQSPHKTLPKSRNKVRTFDNDIWNLGDGHNVLAVIFTVFCFNTYTRYA